MTGKTGAVGRALVLAGIVGCWAIAGGETMPSEELFDGKTPVAETKASRLTAVFATATIGTL